MSDRNLDKTEEIEISSEKPTKSDNSITENDLAVNEEVALEDKGTELTKITDIKVDTPAVEEKIEEKTSSSVKKDNTKNESLDKKTTVEAIKAKSKDDSDAHSHEETEVKSSDHVHHDDDEHAEEKAQKDYHVLTRTELISELQILLKTKSIPEIKHDVEEIRAEFNAKFNDELEHKQEEFLAEGGNIIDFNYSTPDKKEFNSLYFDYKEKRNNHYRALKQDLKANLKKRNELIEELKGLLNAEENINTTYRHFKEIQEKWHLAGAIPRDKYNIVWNTYRHHVENFYDFLHLNREFRDLDFKHNLEQKLKLITRAEELALEPDVNRAFRELQMLHKMWKEEVGPVAKEYRDDVWNKFSLATKVVHDKRFESLKEQEEAFEENYNIKKQFISQINEVIVNTKPSHKGWQNAIKKVQDLRDNYFETGRVPRNKNKEIWNQFKEATRDFNRAKNSFYKNQKKEQYANLEKKRELIKIATENKDSDDFEVVTPLMKKIQSDWRTIGHVPRKDSDKIWNEFKEACNYYFDRIHAQKNEEIKEEMVHYDTKKELLATLSNFVASDDTKTDVSSIKKKITEWKKIGKVPYNKRSIERDFNKAVDGLFGKLDLGKKETELIKFENKLNTMVSEEDERKLQNEQFFITKKIDESKHEILQLENNLGFFKHVDPNTPMVKDVHANIARHKEQLEVWTAKLSKIKSALKG